jgi:UPF0716 family protein affecting phage T7 exclusion
MQGVGLMKGVGVALVLVTALAGAGAGVARAECAGDLAAMQAKLAQVQDAKRREEARLLVEKASLEQQRGRANLCEAALARAGILIK